MKSMQDQILGAFPPGQVVLSQCEVLRANYDDEVLAVSTTLDTTWDRIPQKKVLGVLRSILPLLPADVFFRLLPAYMFVAVEDETGLWLDVLNTLAPPWRKGHVPTFFIDLSPLSKSQRLCICDWCSHVLVEFSPKTNVSRRLTLVRDMLAS